MMNVRDRLRRLLSQYGSHAIQINDTKLKSSRATGVRTPSLLMFHI